ncbi:hypothetical protein P9386_06985 [Caldifermentibacillus hisashii]|uniref:hypothetical protein n=1 Tax=Caldifermentibacillus hisashii TaxID=996558 RepID=UPI0022B95AEA|nr:hypothetical protein [Caldifermentibacillus hisashii]MED4851575.1 hypothetical protein [Caldifermentibacillus hisashii]
MKLKKTYSFMFLILYIFILFFFIVWSNSDLLVWLYTIVFIFSISYLWKTFNTKRTKRLLLLGYLIIFMIQLTYNAIVIYPLNDSHSLEFTKKAIAVFLIFLPFSLLYINYLYVLQNKFFPSNRDGYVLTFEAIKLLQNKGKSFIHATRETKGKINRANLEQILSNIPKHRYTKYTSYNNLPNTFFEQCELSIEEDNKIYIIVSSTGSPASELISVFTKKEYNHVSISFDKDLKTIISYNGGNHVQQPGLNVEDLQSFYQKEDSNILVYSLQATREQKQKLLNKIRNINSEGSAYNLVGLVTKVSLKPNIMFCSQFVYSMLKEVNLHYFEVPETLVKPTDFIEKDYYKKLHFEYEIKFSEYKPN